MLINNWHVAVDPSRARRRSRGSAFEEREPFPLLVRRGEREVSFPRIPTNACRLGERGDARAKRAESSRFLRQPLQPARARTRTHTHTRRHRDWTVNEPARRTNRRPDSPRGFSSRFSRASILLLSDWASAGDGGRGGESRFTG